MAPAEWDEIITLFHAAREKSGVARGVLLEAACGNDTPLRKAVEALLKEDESASGYLSTPVLQSLSDELGESRIAPGQHFGRYIVRDLLGSGGMGEVWSAYDTDLERLVALKFLSSKALAILDSSQISREAKAASALNHPNIVTIYEVAQSGSTLAVVMELIEGSSLRQLIGKPLRANELLEVACQIVRALAAAHRSNIVHGDIKPENILLRHDRYVKVLDFGLARRVTTESIAAAGSTGLGTLRYMSPEQARGEPLTPASDIFSFGLVLYELATGTHAFPAQTPVDAARAILTYTPDPPSSINHAIPSGLDLLIRAMLAKEPWKRPSAEQLATQLSKAPVGSLRSRSRQAGVMAVFTAALLGALWFAASRAHKATSIALTPVPLTTADGFHSWPDISPDGKSVVYGWGASPNAYTHLFLQPLDGDAPIKLVEAEPGTRIAHPRWSPDGQFIYYKRTLPGRGGEAICVVSANGTNRHVVVKLAMAEVSSGIDVSLDEERLIYSDRYSTESDIFGLHSVDLASGKKTLLTAPKTGMGDWDPRFSPDGKTIAFKRVTDIGDDQLYEMPAGGGTARQITSGRHSIWGHAWLTADTLLLSIQWQRMIHGLWRMPAEGSGSLDNVYSSGLDATMPAVRKDRIAWVDQVNDFNIYSVPFGGGKPVKRIASPMYDSQPALAPDGRIAYSSTRSGNSEVWIASADATKEARITDFKGTAANPAWSPDASQIVFSIERFGVKTIFLARCLPGEIRCGPPAPLIEGSHPAWSPDGKFLYFTGKTKNQIWRIPIAGGGPAVYIAKGLSALPSRDGKWIYLRGGHDHPEFSRVQLDAHGAVVGTPKLLLDRGDNADNWEHWTVAQGRIIFGETSVNSSFSGLRAYDTVTKRLCTLVEAPSVEFPAVSPDGKTVWFAQSDAAGARVMTAEINR